MVASLPDAVAELIDSMSAETSMIDIIACRQFFSGLRCLPRTYACFIEGQQEGNWRQMSELPELGSGRIM